MSEESESLTAGSKTMSEELYQAMPIVWSICSWCLNGDILLLLFIFSLAVAEWFTTVAIVGWLSPYFWFIYLVVLAGINFFMGIGVLAYLGYFHHHTKRFPERVSAYLSGMFVAYFLIIAVVTSFLWGFSLDVWTDCVNDAGFVGTTFVLPAAYNGPQMTCYITIQNVLEMIILAAGALSVFSVYFRFRLWQFFDYGFMEAKILHPESWFKSKSNIKNVGSNQNAVKKTKRTLVL